MRCFALLSQSRQERGCERHRALGLCPPRSPKPGQCLQKGPGAQTGAGRNLEGIGFMLHCGKEQTAEDNP